MANLWGRKKDAAEIPFETFMMKPLEEVDPEVEKTQALDGLKAFVTLLGGEVNL